MSAARVLRQTVRVSLPALAAASVVVVAQALLDVAPSYYLKVLVSFICDGRVAALGSHRKLLATSERYAQYAEHWITRVSKGEVVA